MTWLTDWIGGFFGLLMVGFWILLALGDLYWLWMAIQIGSFWMFVIGLIPPCFIVTGPVGAWSLLFDPPDWVLSTFG